MRQRVLTDMPDRITTSNGVVLTCYRETCNRARLAIYRERLATESENGTGHTKKTKSKKMLELKGKYCKDCKIFTNNIDQDALSMILPLPRPSYV